MLKRIANGQQINCNQWVLLIKLWSLHYDDENDDHNGDNLDDENEQIPDKYHYLLGTIMWENLDRSQPTPI